MSDKPTDATISITLSRDRSHQFLEALAHDSGYRRRLTDSPRKALAEHGISVPHGLFPEKVSLPTEHEVRSALDGLEKHDPLAPARAAFQLLINHFPGR